MQQLLALRILVVEDEALLAMLLEDTLKDAGAEVVGPVTTVADALATLSAHPHLDAAVLDLNLAGETSEAVAAELAERGIPYLIASGFDACILPEAQDGAEGALVKPYDPEDLVRKLAAIFA